VIVSWPKLPVLIVLYGEFYCGDANFTCPVVGLIVFDGPAIINSPNCEYGAWSL
jgi:hypothetical protein